MDQYEATTFEHGESTTSAMILMMAAQERGCGCLPYQDWYTYRRWQAQGYQVQKGEHGVRLTVFKTVEEVDRKTGKKKTKSVPKGTTVFCKCQVKPIEQPELPVSEVPVHTIEPPVIKPKPVSVGNGDGRLIEKLRTMADRMQKEIDEKKRPMTQNPTPKRLREYQSRLHDGANLERGQAAMRAMADALELGTLPDILKDTAKTTKGNILSMVSTSWRSDGYYEGSDSGEYADTTPEGRALQAMINGAGPSKEELELQRLEQKAKLMVGQIPGFYPTPQAVAEIVVRTADIRAGMEVMEPSAGSGALADVIRELHPDADLWCVEYNNTLEKLLRLKGHKLYHSEGAGDFFRQPVYKPDIGGGPDRIVMNPPFENKQDVKHIQHAYDCLKPGGRMVAIIPGSANDWKAEERISERFKGWLDDKDWQYYPLPEDAFKESGTGVSTCYIVIDKEG